MEAERHAHRRLPYENTSPGVLRTGTRPLEDATADMRFEDDTRWLVNLTMYGKFQVRMPGQEEWKSYLEWSGARKYLRVQSNTS